MVGHRFLAIPCVDAGGALLDPDQQNCADNQRSYKACATGGCHGGSEVNARSAFQAATNDISFEAAALNSMIAQVPSSEFGAGKVTSGRGAKFNTALASSPGSQVHNPFLIKKLLLASMAALNADYGIALPPGISVAPYDKLVKKSVN